MTLLKNIPVVVNYSRESPHRPGRLTITERGDTIVFRQALDRTEEWENDVEYAVYVPRGLLEALFTPREYHTEVIAAKPGDVMVPTPPWEPARTTTIPVFENRCVDSPDGRHHWVGRFCSDCSTCKNEL